MNQAYAKSCFIAGTRITMADGSTRPIETLRVGEQVLDQHGGSNRDPGDRTGHTGQAQTLRDQ